MLCLKGKSAYNALLNDFHPKLLKYKAAMNKDNLG